MTTYPLLFSNLMFGESSAYSFCMVHVFSELLWKHITICYQLMNYFPLKLKHYILFIFYSQRTYLSYHNSRIQTYDGR